MSNYKFTIPRLEDILEPMDYKQFIYSRSWSYLPVRPFFMGFVLLDQNISVYYFVTYCFFSLSCPVIYRGETTLRGTENRRYFSKFRCTVQLAVFPIRYELGTDRHYFLLFLLEIFTAEVEIK